MSQPFHILASLRHDCTGCGGCCHGVVVFLSQPERLRVRAFAQQWGLPDPVQDDKFRFVDGRCVFQGEDEHCRIHVEHGLEAKPLLCQQYPLALVRTAQGVRAGVDPGCYDGWQSWKDGPLLQGRAGAVESRKLSPKAARHEDKLLDQLDLPELTISRLASMLTDELPAERRGLPPTFARRVVERVKDAGLSGLLTKQASGAMLHDVMKPVLEHAEGLALDDLPPWPVLAPAEEAFALEILQRLLWLRPVRTVNNPTGVVVLGVVGVMLCAWHDPAPASFGPALAGWTRIMRSPVFLEALAPQPADLLRLATGR